MAFTDRPLEIWGFFANAAANVVLTLVEYTVLNAHCTLGDDKEVCWANTNP